MRQQFGMMGGGAGGFGGATKAAAPAGGAGRGYASDVEAAVIGHGHMEGAFTEIGDLKIERDPNLPVRVTVQFYKATSNGVVSPGDIDAVKHEIDGVYEHGDNVGSLVTDGETGRPTEYVGLKVQPFDWWQSFWQRHEENTGDSPAVAKDKLRRLLGHDFESRPVSDIYLHDLLRPVR